MKANNNNNTNKAQNSQKKGNFKHNIAKKTDGDNQDEEA